MPSGLSVPCGKSGEDHLCVVSGAKSRHIHICTTFFGKSEVGPRWALVDALSLYHLSSRTCLLRYNGHPRIRSPISLYTSCTKQHMRDFNRRQSVVRFQGRFYATNWASFTSTQRHSSFKSTSSLSLSFLKHFFQSSLSSPTKYVKSTSSIPASSSPIICSS